MLLSKLFVKVFSLKCLFILSDDPAPTAPAAAVHNDDPFGDWLGSSNSAPAPVATTHVTAANGFQQPSQAPAATPANSVTNGSSSQELFGVFGDAGAQQNGGDAFASGAANDASQQTATGSTGDGKKSKESILALFGNSSQQQPQAYGMPGS